MNQQQQGVPLQTINYNAGCHQEPMVNLAASSGYPSGNDQSWKHFLTNIPPTVTKKLTFIGVFYIIIGLLNIALEFVLIFGVGVGFYGAFGNGLLLFIVGVVTLVLCRQQIYTLTSLHVLLIFQLHATIIVFGFYVYCTIFVFSTLVNCSNTTYHVDCSLSTTAAVVVIVDLVHLFLTISIIIVNLVIINNARRPPTASVRLNYVMHNPQSQVMPVTYHNPHAMTLNSTN